MDISSRLPSRDKIIPVYAVIVVMVYAWTIMAFNYNLPAWLGFLNVGDIFSIFTYAMATNFLESLVVLAGIVFVSAVLPRSWFLEAFVARGAALSAMGLAWMMYLAQQFTTKEYYPAEPVRWTPALLLAMLAAAYFIGRVTFLRRAVEFIADRAIIFLYISIPISILSVLAVLLRNII